MSTSAISKLAKMNHSEAKENASTKTKLTQRDNLKLKIKGEFYEGIKIKDEIIKGINKFFETPEEKKQFELNFNKYYKHYKDYETFLNIIERCIFYNDKLKEERTKYNEIDTTKTEYFLKNIKSEKYDHIKKVSDEILSNVFYIEELASKIYYENLRNLYLNENISAVGNVRHKISTYDMYNDTDEGDKHEDLIKKFFTFTEYETEISECVYDDAKYAEIKKRYSNIGEFFINGSKYGTFIITDTQRQKEKEKIIEKIQIFFNKIFKYIDDSKANPTSYIAIDIKDYKELLSLLEINNKAISEKSQKHRQKYIKYKTKYLELKRKNV